jgi:GAF domain-containing protein
MTNQPDFFRTFCKVSRAFSTTLSSEKLLNLIVTSAVDSMNAKAACLFLADEEKDVFVPVAQRGLSENYLHAGPLQAKKIVGAILKGGHLHIKDATSDPRVENHEAKKAEGIASILDVPVMVRDKAIGVLALYSAKPRDFGNDEIDFLSALAEQGGMAIERARLLDRLRNNSRIFLELISSINSTLDIRKILHGLTAEICKALGMKGAVVRLVNDKTDTLDLITTYGLNEQLLKKESATPHPSVSEALRGKTVIVQDLTVDEHNPARAEIMEEGIVSMLSIPIMAKKEVIGVMALYNAAKRKYPVDVLMLVEALAHAGALAIQNASMYLRLQQDKENLEKDMWSHRSWF